MVLQQFKNWMLPIAMITGGLFYPFFSQLAPVIPYLIFCMLLVPYCKISLTRIRIKPLHLFLILIQIIGGLGIYTALSFYDPLVAQGIFICVLAPTATSAAVITGMLGGNVASLATFSLLSNLCVAVLSPLIFSFIGEHVSMPFGHSFGIICRQMIPLLILPFVLALLLRRFLPRVHHEIKKRQELSFYMWSVALATVTGNTVSFLMRQDASNYRIETIMALLALVHHRTQDRAPFPRQSRRSAGSRTEKHDPCDLDGTDLPQSRFIGRPRFLCGVAEHREFLPVVAPAARQRLKTAIAVSCSRRV